MVFAIILVVLALALLGTGLFVASLKILLWVGLAVLVVAVVVGGVGRLRR